MVRLFKKSKQDEELEDNLSEDEFIDDDLSDQDNSGFFSSSNKKNDQELNTNDLEFGQPLMEADNIKNFLSSANEITSIVSTLQGKFKSKNGKYIKVKGIKPIMNDKGVIRIYSFLNITLTKITSMGMLQQNEAKERTLGLMLPLILQISLNKIKWDVNLAEMSVIVPSIEGLIHSHLTRSINRGEAKLYSGMISQDEHITHENNSSSIKF